MRESVCAEQRVMRVRRAYELPGTRYGTSGPRSANDKGSAPATLALGTDESMTKTCMCQATSYASLLTAARTIAPQTRRASYGHHMSSRAVPASRSLTPSRPTTSRHRDVVCPQYVDRPPHCMLVEQLHEPAIRCRDQPCCPAARPRLSVFLHLVRRQKCSTAQTKRASHRREALFTPAYKSIGYNELRTITIETEQNYDGV